ncbi:substrate-binding periplasmic protein [Thalassotalea euphylliae]|uniref:substrate-binding periplasmic protein n=1 Tax=Thalassotalea euphylliae TaxID=1655234 RepID=UPI003640BD82
MTFFKFLIIFSLLAINSAVSACQLSVHIVSYPPLAIPPNTAFNQSNQWQGTNFSYLDALFKQAKCDYTLIDAPFGRGINLLERGQIDMTLNFSKTPEREQYFQFIGPHREEKILLATPRWRFPPISTWQELEQADAHFIWQTGAYYGENMEELVSDQSNFKGTISYQSDNEVMIDLVARKRADGFFVESDFLSFHQQYDQRYQQLSANPLIINSEPVYFAFSKSSVDQATFERFERAFDTLKEQGMWQRLEANAVNTLLQQLLDQPKN